MAVTTFAAIDISSYEISMKIFEFSRKGGFRTVDDIRYRLNLGVGVYSGGTMEVDKVDTICEVLGDFKRIMAEYGVKEYRACTTSVFREMKNPIIIIEQIYRRTGIHVEVLSNAEQHFLGYKSIAAIENGFKKMIQKGTAILDVGGGNLQISLFDKDALVTTQSLKMGSVRIRQRLKELEKTNTNYAQLVEEFIRKAGRIDLDSPELSLSDRLEYAKDQVVATVKKVAPYIFIGVGIGALIHNFIPQSFVETVLGGDKWYSVPLATLVGVPMYADIFGTIPVAESLFAKGAGLGTILSFMMAVTALSLPSMIMLRKAVKPKLLAVFFSIVTVGIMLIGFLFNYFSFLFVV